MDWYSKLYVGKRAQKKKETLIRKIESGKTPVNTYLLTLPYGEANQLEIVPAWNLRFWYAEKSCPVIVGIGCGRKEAVGLVQQILEESLKRTGSADMRRYLERRMENGI